MKKLLKVVVIVCISLSMLMACASNTKDVKNEVIELASVTELPSVKGVGEVKDDLGIPSVAGLDAEVNDEVRKDIDSEEIHAPNAVIESNVVENKLDTIKAEVKELKELSDVELEEYKKYDNVVIDGEALVKLIKKVHKESKKVAVLVATQMVMDGTSGFNKLDANIATDTPIVGVSGIVNLKNTLGKDMVDKLTYINYGAILEADRLIFDTDHIESATGFLKKDDNYLFNSSIANITTEWSSECIAEYVLMQAYVVYDKEGNFLGLAFHELS